MKKLLYSISNTEDLLKIQNLLNNAGIAFNVKPKMSSMIFNILNMVFYHVLTSGVERENKVVGIYVEKDVYERASGLIHKNLKEK